MKARRPISTEAAQTEQVPLEWLTINHEAREGYALRLLERTAPVGDSRCVTQFW